MRTRGIAPWGVNFQDQDPLKYFMAVPNAYSGGLHKRWTAQLIIHRSNNMFCGVTALPLHCLITFYGKKQNQVKQNHVSFTHRSFFIR